MVALGGRGCIAPTHFLPRHSMEVSGQRHAPAALCPGEKTPGTHWTGGWVDPKAGLVTEARGKIICPCRGSNPDRPVVQSVVRQYTAWATPAPHLLRLYSVYDRVTSQWWWWIDENNIHDLSGIRTHGLRVQAIKAYVSHRAVTGTGTIYFRKCFSGNNYRSSGIQCQHLQRFSVWYINSWFTIIHTTINTVQTF
jgi:hypothetical protein